MIFWDCSGWARYVHLFGDVDVRRWYDNVARGSKVTADVTKVWPSNASYEGVLRSARASVKRLRTYIDLYLLHSPSDYEICETIGAFERLVDEEGDKAFRPKQL